LSIYGGSLWRRRCQDLISLQKCDRTCDVRAGSFPSDAESFHSPAELREQLPAKQRT